MPLDERPLRALTSRDARGQPAHSTPSSASQAQSAPRCSRSSGNPHDVLDLVQRGVSPEQHNNADILGELLAEDFVGVGPVGFVLTRGLPARLRRQPVTPQGLAGVGATRRDGPGAINLTLFSSSLAISTPLVCHCSSCYFRYCTNLYSSSPWPLGGCHDPICDRSRRAHDETRGS